MGHMCTHCTDRLSATMSETNAEACRAVRIAFFHLARRSICPVSSSSAAKSQHPPAVSGWNPSSTRSLSLKETGVRRVDPDSTTSPPPKPPRPNRPRPGNVCATCTRLKLVSKHSRASWLTSVSPEDRGSDGKLSGCNRAFTASWSCEGKVRRVCMPCQALCPYHRHTGEDCP